jgi:hypothetical protein
LVPRDVHLFGPLKNQLGGKRFADDEEVETEVRKWLRQPSKDFYFEALLKRLGKCIDVGEGYVEKQKYFFHIRISIFYVLYSFVTIY